MNKEEYLISHGISPESTYKFGLSSDNEKLVIPVKDREGNLLFNKYRLFSGKPKYKFDEGSEAILFNSHVINENPFVVICEGEIDCIRLDQEGIPAVTSTAGAMTFKEEWIKMLEGKKVFLCFDNDDAGKKGMEKVAALLPTPPKIIKLPDNIKDVSDFFLEHNKEEYLELAKKAQPYSPIPIITMEDLLKAEYPEENWLIDKFLPEESMTLIVGEAGTFKSFLSLYIAKVLSSQEKFLGNFKVKRKANILIIDKENKLRRIQKRAKGMKFPPTSQVTFLQYPDKFMLADDNEFMKHIKELVDIKKIDVIILDSFIDMFVGSENSSTDTAMAFNAVRSISPTATYILLHHDSKPMPKVVRTAAQKTRGSSNIIAQVDTQFYLEKQKDKPGFIIEQGKARDEQPLGKFIVDLIITNEEVTDFKYMGEFKNDVKLAEETADILFESIKDKPMIARDELVQIVEAAEIDPRMVSEGLAILKQKLLIDSVRKPGLGNKLFYIPVGGGD